MPKHQTIAILWLVTLLTAMPASAASIYRIKADIAKGTVLTREQFVEVPLSKSSSPLIDVFQQSLMGAYVTDRWFNRYLGRAIPHDLPAGGYLMRADFTLYGSVENVPSAKNPPREKRPLLESGREATNSRSIQWLDDTRVLFVGFDPSQPGIGGNLPARQKHLYIWHLETGEITLYRKSVYGNLCVAGDWVRYRVANEDGHNIYRAGPFGDERPIRQSDLFSSMRDRPYHLPRGYCSRFMPDEEFIPVDGAIKTPWVYPLRAEHGYLVEARTAPNTETLSLQRPGHEAIPLNLDPKAPRGHTIRYYPFAGRYYIDSKFRVSTDVAYLRSDCAINWWLDPAGGLEEICVPWGAWEHVFPFRNGLLLVQMGIWDPDDGIHLYRDGRRVQVFQGVVGSPAVSPDGCRVAFTTQTVIYRRGLTPKQTPMTLKVLELCNGQPA